MNIKSSLFAPGLLCAIGLTFVLSGPRAIAANRSWAVADLHCEYHVDPLGIDSVHPRLQWIVQSTTRGEGQTAYQILVASSPLLLDENRGDLWDSGKVISNQTNQIAYDGKRLHSNEPCYWKIRAWDKFGVPSTWSLPASWSMGLLSPNDWKARWIGYDAAYTSDSELYRTGHRLDLSFASWLSLPTGVVSPDETMYLRFHFVVSADRQIARAIVAVSGDNEGTAEINGHEVGEFDRWEKTALLDASSVVQVGDNVAALKVHNTDYLGPQLVGKIVLIFKQGDDIVIPIDLTSKVSPIVAQGWDQIGFSDLSWTAPKAGRTPWGTPTLSDKVRTPVPFLRKEFLIEKPVSRATVFVAALGLYELHLNGARVGSDYFTPGWTDFRKRVHYETYDVTQLVHRGPNAIGALLGDGWYAGCLAFTGKRNWYGGTPRLLVQLEIYHPDGTKDTVVSNGGWKASFGPIKQADLLVGDVYDDRVSLSGWDTPGFDDSNWSDVDTRPNTLAPGTAEATTPLIQADPGEPVRITNVFPAVKMTEPSPGLYTFDLGQNIVGWTSLKVMGAPGQKITVRHGEMLNPDGTVYLANLRSASGTDIYYLNGRGIEDLHPYFTLKGFRYVEVRGLTYKPALSDLSGIVVRSDMLRTGSFGCSDPLLNQLYHNIVWGQNGNYIAVPTDCPQRDERAGWTGDTEFFMPTAAYNYDVSGFFNSWLMTMCEDSQYPDGSFASVAPDLKIGNGATAWGDAALQCTYHMYQVYGDRRIIRVHYAAMSRYMDFLASKSQADIAHVGGYEDWLNKGGGADPAVIDTAYYAYLAGIMSEMAQAIGKTDDADRYSKLHDDIKAAFDTAFVAPDGSILNSSQTAYALAFTMGLVPQGQGDAVTDQFVGQLQRFNWHLATGFIGTPRLLPALHEAGKDSAAYKILLQETYPGWLFQVKQGATTMWERWDGWTPTGGFQSIGMNSFNHYSFGAVGQYLYADVAGISADQPGYKHIIIRPELGIGVTSAHAEYDSIAGPVATNWVLTGSILKMQVKIPANVDATVYVPSTDGSVTEGGKPAGKVIGVKFLKQENGFAVYAVQSGTYRFVASSPALAS